MLKSPFQLAFHTDLPAFVWAQSKPQLVHDFGLWMGTLHDGQKTWLDVCDFKRLVNGSTPETPIFVDIGGGLGHQCALLKTIPDLVGRVVLQDLPQAIEHALPTAGVEKMVFDFWGEQPIKGQYLSYGFSKRDEPLAFDGKLNCYSSFLLACQIITKKKITAK